jgi:hypothetical protein
MEVEQIFDGTPILRGVTPNEVTNAVKTIFLKRGSNAPTKTALTNVKGEDVEPTTIIWGGKEIKV